MIAVRVRAQTDLKNVLFDMQAVVPTWMRNRYEEVLLVEKTDVATLRGIDQYEVRAAAQMIVLTPAYIGHKKELLAALAQFS